MVEVSHHGSIASEELWRLAWRCNARELSLTPAPTQAAHVMRLGRIVTVTLSIALIGAIIGGAVGAVLFAVWSLPIGFDRGPFRLEGAAYGAMLGAVLAPITAWAFLRRVPLGKALLQVTVGTTIGTVIGLVVDRFGVTSIATLPAGLIGALMGFLAAAIRLRFATRTTGAEQGMESPGPRARS